MIHGCVGCSSGDLWCYLSIDLTFQLFYLYEFVFKIKMYHVRPNTFGTQILGGEEVGKSGSIGLYLWLSDSSFLVPFTSETGELVQGNLLILFPHMQEPQLRDHSGNFPREKGVVGDFCTMSDCQFKPQATRHKLGQLEKNDIVKLILLSLTPALHWCKCWLQLN